MERMIDDICRFNSSLKDLFEMLNTNLDDVDGVIVDGDRDGTKETVYGSEDQIGLMKRMWNSIQEVPTDRDTIFRIREEVEAETAGEGPLFFRLMVTVYRWWVQKWSEENVGDSGSEGDVEEEEDDEDMQVIDVSREDVIGMEPGARMGALLNKLGELGSVTKIL